MEASRGSTVLVTGGSGFLGGWCLVELLRSGPPGADHGAQLVARARGPLDARQRGGGRRPALGLRRPICSATTGWAEAVEGCDYVLHVASPFPPSQPKDPDELIVPAREGTLRVLRAALEAGVKRVVVTSSVAAVRNGGEPAHDAAHRGGLDRPRRIPASRLRALEDDRRAGGLGARPRARPGRPAHGRQPGPDRRAVAERRPLLLARRRSSGCSTGCPGCRGLASTSSTSATSPSSRSIAMSSPEAGGERLIAVERWLWMADVAEILRRRLGDRAAKVPTRTVPNILVRAMAVFDTDAALGDRRSRPEGGLFEARRQGPGWAGPRARARRQSSIAPRASSLGSPPARRWPGG